MFLVVIAVAQQAVESARNGISLSGSKMCSEALFHCVTAEWATALSFGLLQTAQHLDAALAAAAGSQRLALGLQLTVTLLGARCMLGRDSLGGAGRGTAQRNGRGLQRYISVDCLEGALIGQQHAASPTVPLST